MRQKGEEGRGGEGALLQSVHGVVHCLCPHPAPPRRSIATLYQCLRSKCFISHPGNSMTPTNPAQPSPARLHSARAPDTFISSSQAIFHSSLIF